MFIKVTYRAQAIDMLRRGATLWCVETGEGWTLRDPAHWSKRAIQRFLARRYADARVYTGGDVFHFEYGFLE